MNYFENLMEKQRNTIYFVSKSFLEKAAVNDSLYEILEKIKQECKLDVNKHVIMYWECTWFEISDDDQIIELE